MVKCNKCGDDVQSYFEDNGQKLCFICYHTKYTFKKNKQTEKNEKEQKEGTGSIKTKIGWIIVIAFFVVVLFYAITSDYESDREGIELPKNWEFESPPFIWEKKSDAITISYDELMRNSDNYKEANVYFRGRIFSVTETYDDNYDLLVATRSEAYIGYYKDVIWINYKGSRLLEDDIIDIWGYVKGLKTYTTVLGSQKTIPELDAYYLGLVTKAGEQ